MTTTRWMALLTTDGEPPRGLPPGTVLIRLDGGNPAPAAGETVEQQADELNTWPSSAPPAVQVPAPDYEAAVAARRGNTHAPD